MVDFAVHRSETPLPAAEREAVLAAPGFGEHFTDHMAIARWSQERGWHDARIEPYTALTLDPATSAFHYAQEMFEGMKAYRQDGGAVVLFRPWENAARFNRSARRLAMPELPEDAFVRMLELLVTQDQAWVPGGDGFSLYLRPFMIATQRGLGFTLPSATYLLCAIASPATYLGGGDPTPLRVWLSDEHSRAVPGGTGAVKAACNYAPAFAAQQHARSMGCDQVVWLDAAEHRWVEEMGGMNLFFVYDDGPRPRIVTPPLTGTLLPGVTRDALLRLAPTLGLDAEECAITTAQWRSACATGAVTEVFACGTAATVIPVGEVRSRDGGWVVGDGAAGSITLRLRRALMDIQYGRQSDPFDWVHKIC